MKIVHDGRQDGRAVLGAGIGTSHFGGASSNLAPVNIVHRRLHCNTIKHRSLTLTESYN